MISLSCKRFSRGSRGARGKSKTAGGKDRVIPLSETAFKALQDWRREFPDAAPSHYVFLTERYGLAGQAQCEPIRREALP
jgi:integrase